MHTRINSTIPACLLWVGSLAAGALAGWESSLVWLVVAGVCVGAYTSILRRWKPAWMQSEYALELAEVKVNPAGHKYVYSVHGPEGCRGRCKCGWTGGTQEEAEAAHDEYREHVTQQLGHKARYSAAVVCGNCSYRGTVKPFVGMYVHHVDCPRCGLGRLEPSASREQEIDSQLGGSPGPMSEITRL
jgi:Zn ribbon nucleic-acid-binding protein